MLLILVIADLPELKWKDNRSSDMKNSLPEKESINKQAEQILDYCLALFNTIR